MSASETRSKVLTDESTGSTAIEGKSLSVSKFSPFYHFEIFQKAPETGKMKNQRQALNLSGKKENFAFQQTSQTENLQTDPFNARISEIFEKQTVAFERQMMIKEE